jgi:3-oxoadipate enol-lactonase
MARLAPDTPQLRLHRSGRGPAVVLLHCLGVDHHIWDETTLALSDTHEVIRYDFPGHGDSPVPANGYTIEDLSAQLRDALAAAGIDKVSLAGISLGGLVAQHFAAMNPDCTDRLVLIDTTPRYSDMLRGMWAERAATARTKGVTAMTTPLLDIWFTPAFVAKNPPGVQYVRDCFARVSGEGYALACEALAGGDLRPLVPRITAPAMVVCGTEDIPEFIEAANWLHAQIAGSKLEWLSPARHCSILEQPEAFNRLCRDFLAIRK